MRTPVKEAQNGIVIGPSARHVTFERVRIVHSGPRRRPISLGPWMGYRLGGGMECGVGAFAAAASAPGPPRRAVEPAGIYLEQLRERLGDSAVSNNGY